MSGKDGGWILPETIDPERICITLYVPNEPRHLQAFWGALWELAYWFNWQRDPDHRAAAAAEVWKEVWYAANDAFNAGARCEAFMPEFRIVDCDLQWRADAGATWVSLGNVCGADGLPGAPGADGLPGAPGADGECPDCPPAGADLCRFAWATVEGMSADIQAFLSDLALYKSANPTATYLEASDALYGGLAFNVGNQALLTDFIQSIYAGDGIEAFQELLPEALDEIACALFQSLTTDYINDVTLTNWQDCIFPVVSEPFEFMLLMPTLDQWRAWEVESYPATAPHDCGDCEECNQEKCYEWDFTVSDGGWAFTSLGVVGSYVSGQGWHVQNFGGVEEALLIEKAFPACHVTRFEVDLESTPINTGWTLGYHAGGSFSGFWGVSGGSGSGGTYQYVFTTPQDITSGQLVYINIDNGAANFCSPYVRKLRIFYTGDDPTGGDACDE